MVRLASVEFTKLKNVRPGTRLTFSESGAVLLGKNGTGKTTLLEYLVALCTADISVFMGAEPFDVSAVFKPDMGWTASLRLTGSSRRQEVETATEPTSQVRQYRDTEQSTGLEYVATSADRASTYKIAITNGQAALYYNDEPLCTPFLATNQDPLAHCLSRLISLASSDNGSHVAWLTKTSVETSWLKDSLCRYDEGLHYFNRMTDETSSYLTLILTFGGAGESTIGVLGSLGRFPADLVQSLLRNYVQGSQPEFFSAGHTETAFLREFTRLCKFSAATAIAAVESSDALQGGTFFEWRRLRFSFEHAKTRISHRKLSFGQKRLLSYLYYLACNRQIAVADELVNGMHHEWIDYCLGDACAGRQMFYTSQNPLLLDFLSFESADEVSGRFVTCKWDEHERFIWENLEPRVGEEFYRLYKTGIQHVSDILRTKNWW